NAEEEQKTESERDLPGHHELPALAEEVGDRSPAREEQESRRNGLDREAGPCGGAAVREDPSLDEQCVEERRSGDAQDPGDARAAVRQAREEGIRQRERDRSDEQDRQIPEDRGAE